MKNYYLKLIGTLALFIALQSVANDQVPTITSFTPTSGPIGTEVTITGTNFDTTLANNIVFFGATQATVSAATSTSLTVTVPTGASYMPITVLTNGLIAYASSQFIVTFGGAGIDTNSFADAIDLTTGSGPYSVAIGDLDGDGKSDLAVANISSNTVSVFRNTSTGTGTVSYDAKMDFATDTSPISVAIGDLDGDGKLDLAVANSGSTTLSIFRNTSTGAGTVSYDAKVDYATGSSPYSVVIGDLDGDGKSDLAVANRGSSTLSTFRNTSTGAGTISFAAKLDYATGSTPSSIAMGDFDSDGKPDLVVANRNDNTVSVLRNTSAGAGNVSFDTKVDFTTGVTPNAIAVGDLDGDGKIDLAVGNNGNDARSVSVLRNTSTGSGNISYDSKIDFTTGVNLRSVAIGDLDGDNMLDIVATGTGSNQLSILRNTSVGDGNIAYAPQFQLGVTPVPTSTAIGDLDGDGRADLIAAMSTSTTQKLSVFRNTIASAATDFTAFSLAEQVGEAVINATDHTVAVKVTAGTNLIALVPTFTLSDGASAAVGINAHVSGTTSFNFTNAVTYTITAENSTTTQDWVVTVEEELPFTIASFSPTSGTIGTTVTITGTNFDLTPANNIVFFGATQATVSAATATQLTVTVPSGASYQPITVLVDGLMAYSASPFVVTFPGGGTVNATSFDAKQDYTTGSNPYSVAIGDLDGDGKADLAIANGSSNTVSVFRNISTAVGSISYAAKQDYTTGSNPYSVAIGDLDGDGKLDLAVANRNGSTISVFRNTSTGSGTISYASKVDYSTGSGPRSVAIGDLDGDGKADLAVVNWDISTVSIFRNTSTGAGTIDYATKVDYTTGSQPHSVAIGDLDGDGKTDLAVANRSSGSVSILRNTSTGTGTINFATKVDYSSGTQPHSVAIGDLNGDGKADLAVVNVQSNTVSLFQNTSTGSGNISYAAKVDYTSGTNTWSVAIGDLNGDGKPDLVLGYIGSNTAVSILQNTSTGSGSISYATKVDQTTGTGPYSTAIGDLDGDGKLDVVVGNVSDNTVSVLRNAIESTTSTETDLTAFSLSEQTGAATIDATNHTIAIEVANGTDVTALVPTFELSTGASAAVGGTAQVSGTTANDFTSAVTYTVTAEDGTTTQDWVVTVTEESSTGSVPTISTFSPTSGPIGTEVTITGTNFSTTAANNIVFFGATQATVSAATSTSLTVTVPTGASYQPITVLVDGLMAYAASPFVVTFDGGGTIDSSSFDAKQDYTTGTQPRTVAIGDLDGDGKVDLAVANYTSNTVSVFRNTSTAVGTISYAAKQDYTTGTGPWSVAIGDLDGDGKADLAVANYISNTVSVYRNTSTGVGTIGYAAKQDYTTGSNPRSVAIGDLDGDGKADLAVANYISNTVSVLRNTSTAVGTISYAAKQDYTTGTGAYSVAIGDLDGDGKADLAVVNVSSTTVSVFRNTSTGVGTISYATKQDYTTGTQPYLVAIGDLDGDGKADLAVANYVSNTVSVFRNTSTDVGTMNYAAKQDYTTGNAPNSVVICDLDGDGKVDLAIVNQTSRTVSVFRNTSTAVGTISYAAKQDYTTGSNPYSVAIGDLDGDGKADLAVVNGNANTVSVFRNAIVTPAAIPTLTSFTPTSGPIGTEVTITGTNFSTTAANNIVFFGATQATVSAATATQLTVKVPSGASYQPITVLVDGLMAYSASPFVVTFTGGGTIDASSFAAKQDYTTGSAPYSVAIGDLDGDGKADLAVANRSSNTVSVFRNTSTAAGTISYATKQDYTTGTGPISVTLGDLNGNGKADLAVANRTSATVSLFRNTSTAEGKISYDSKQDFITETGPWSVALGDLDGDGKADLAVANGSSASFSVFRNAIESTVSTETDITAFSLSEQTGAATIDGTNHTIAIEVASGTDATALVPTFALSTGASATVGATAQVSGTTANDFTSAVTYTVTAADGTTTQDWVVTVQINSSGITGAPVPPARAAGDVISIFSDAYTNITNTNFNPNWNQSTVVTIEDIEGNSTLKYANFNYQGMDLGSAQDVSGMEYLHVDFWTSDATILQVTPVEPSGSPSELLVSLTPIVADSWNSFDIPLTDFTGSGMILSDVPQLKFEGDGSNPSTIYIDNIYFYKTVSGGDVTAPTVTTFSPADNATSISANSNLVMTFSENIQKGSGNILIKEGGVTRQTIAVTNSSVSISGNVVTINPADFTSGSTVNVEMAAGVFQDLANNNYAGITNTTTWNFTVAAAATNTPPTISNQTFDIDENSAANAVVGTVVASDDDQDALTYSIVSGNTSQAFAIGTSTGELTVNSSNALDYETNPSFSLSVRVSDGNASSSATITINLNDIDESLIGTLENQIVQPSGGSGTSQRNYSIISFPFRNPSVSTLLGELGPYDNSQWRLFRYNGSNQEYSVNFTDINSGQGYWFIQRESNNIQMGGTSVDITEGSYKMNLVNGFNLIGNPFAGTLNWREVIDYNVDKGTISLTDFESENQTSIYTWRTSWRLSSNLEKFEGGFIKTTRAISNFEIPLSAVNNAGGRIAQELPQKTEIYIDDEHWKLNFHLHSPSYDYYLGGIGLSPLASDQKDILDGSTLPRFIEYLEVDFGDGITRSMKHLDENKSWSFKLPNNLKESSIHLTWDRPISSVNTIILIDSKSQQIVDLSSSSGINVSNDPTIEYYVYFGKKESILDQLNLPFDVIHEIYPNPTENKLNIRLYASDHKVGTLKLISMDGKEILNYSINLEKGMNNHEIRLEELQVPEGIYYLNINNRISTKLIKK
ncbi:MAG: FG-GAP-like repeat-containing protein [Cyclobacteriaceae bacterium]